MNLPEGWPTEAMVNAGIVAYMNSHRKNAKEAMAFIFKDMLTAAPTPPAQESGTPGAKWRENGESDPHGDTYNCERAALCMGGLTDDEIANAVFLHGNETPDIRAVMRGEAYMPLTYLTAAKDRIRWLSRKVEELSSKEPPAQEDEPVAVVTSVRNNIGGGAISIRKDRSLDPGDMLYTHSPTNSGRRRRN